MSWWISRPVLTALAALALSTPGSAQSLKISVPVGELEKVARTDSADAIAQYNLAIGYWSRKRWDEAGAALDRAIALEPRLALAYLARAYLPFARRPKLWDELEKDDLTVEQRNQLDQINRDYRRAFFFDPLVDLRIVGATLRGKSYIWEVSPSLSALWNTWVKGFEDFRDGDYASAYRRLERMVELSTETGKRGNLERVPESILWYQALAAAHLGMHDVALRNGREVYDRNVKRDAEKKRKEELIFTPLRTNEYRYVLGVLNAGASRSEEALRLFEEALTSDAGLYMAHVHRAGIYEARGALRQALAERRAAVAANPEDPTSHLELAITLSRTGAVAEAEEVLLETARTNPLNARAHYLLGILSQQVGKPEQARPALERFLALVPARHEREIQDARQRLGQLP